MIQVEIAPIMGGSVEVRWTTDKTGDFTVRLMRGPTELDMKRIPVAAGHSLGSVARFNGLERDHQYVVVVEAPDGERQQLTIRSD